MDRNRTVAALAVLAALLVVGVALVRTLGAPPDGAAVDLAVNGEAPVEPAPAPAVDLATPAERAPEPVRPSREAADDPGPAAELVTAAETWTLTGEVRTPTGPLAGALVRVDFPAPAEATFLATTDAEGTFSEPMASLGHLSRLQLDLLQYDLRVSAEGHRTTRSRRRVEVEGERTIFVRAILRPGHVTRGRVVEADGSPAANVLVSLLETASQTPRVRARARTDAEGRYELVPSSAFTGYVEAHDSARGFGRVDGLRIDPARTAEIPDLVLAAGGRLEGVAVDPAGAPIESLRVVALSTAGRPRDRRAETVVTDRDGRFRFLALAGGPVQLDSPERVAIVEGAGPHAVGAPDVRLVVDARRLVVRVTDPEGSPLLGPIITCTEVREEGPEPGRIATLARQAQPADPEATFFLAAAGTYVVQCVTDLAKPVERTVELGPSERRVEVALVLEPLEATGTLRVLVRDGPKRDLPLAVDLVHPVTGLTLYGQRRIDATGRLEGVAPGSYRVRIRPLDGPRLEVLSDGTVEVVAGEERTIEVSLSSSE